MNQELNARDEELITLLSRCAIRDQKALKALFERVGAYMNAVIYRIVLSDEVANEVLQDAFLQIWQNAASYRSDLAKPLTWMTSIARYRALDRKDKEQRYSQNIPTAKDESLLENIEDERTPEKEFSSKHLDQPILDCLGALNDNISRCIQMAYIHGYSREELAEKFNTKTNTVKSWLHRGSERLKECLQNKMQWTTS
ncbi:ECF RNA polymerase sigma factor SigK [Thalassocella blandensis]|nr:ECF RNA polymerase sigma factor SigK [Thalassocella blandensis]